MIARQTRPVLTRFAPLLFACLALFGSLHSSVQGETPHPFHICVGEMEWNQESKKWEVSLRLHPSDLQAAVSRVAGKRIEIDPAQKAPPELVQYLESHFYLSTKKFDPNESREKTPQLNVLPNSAKIAKDQPLDGKGNSKVNWVGMEAERGWLWIYFELIPDETAQPSVKEESVDGNQPASQPGTSIAEPAAPKAANVFLTHRLLLADVENQTNTILIRQGKARHSLRYVKNSESHPLP